MALTALCLLGFWLAGLFSKVSYCGFDDSIHLIYTMLWLRLILFDTTYSYTTFEQ